MRTLKIALVALGCLGYCAGALAQSLPVDIRQDATRYNLQSTNGMALSSTANTPPGSDGRAPGPSPGPVGTA